MKFTVDKHEKYVLLQLKERQLNSVNIAQFKSELILINTEGQRNIILDLSMVEFIDSSGLSSFLIGDRICKGAKGQFILTGLQDAVKRLIAISKLDKVLTIVPTTNEAMDLIFIGEIEKELKQK